MMRLKTGTIGGEDLLVNKQKTIIICKQKVKYIDSILYKISGNFVYLK